jgi:hypothetical protein
MNMIPTFQQLAQGLTADLRLEAARCVRVHGRGGKGDPEGADNILQQKAAYVSVCIGCEQVRDPENILAQELGEYLRLAFLAYNADVRKDVTVVDWVDVLRHTIDIATGKQQ